MANLEALQKSGVTQPEESSAVCRAEVWAATAKGAGSAQSVYTNCLRRSGSVPVAHILPSLEITNVHPTESSANRAKPEPDHGSYQEARDASNPNIPLSRMQTDTQGIFSSVNAPTSRVGAEIETRAFWHGDRHAMTPNGLGSEGCMIAVSKYAIGPVLKENGIHSLNGVPVDAIQESHAFLQGISEAQADRLNTSRQTVDGPLASVTLVRQSDLHASDLQPGDIVVGVKPTAAGKAVHNFDGRNLRFDYHTSVATRIPENWGNYPGGMMLVGNTGLDMTHVAGGGPHDPSKPAGNPTVPHMRTAQEVIGTNTEKLNSHHGQLNSQSSANPYRGGYFYIVRMHDLH